MTEFVKEPSENYKKAVSALRNLLSAESEEIVSRAFAEVVQEARKNNFIKMQNVTPSNHSHVCIYRLLGKKCPGHSTQIIPCADHCSEWQKDGQTVIIISQPYSLGYQDIKDTIMFCEEYGLEATVEARSSWHFPSTTVCVEYRRRIETK